MNWRMLPMPRLLLPLVVGIGVGDEYPISWAYKEKFYWMIAGALLLLCTALLIRPNFQHRAWFGTCIFLILIGLGLLRMQQSHFWENSSHFSLQQTNDSSGVWGKILETRPSPNSYRVLLQVKATQASDSVWQSAEGKLLAYLKIAEGQAPPQQGQYLYLSGAIERVKPPLNPDAFDFRAYLQRQGIYHQVFAPEGAWKLDSTHSQAPLTLRLRRFCLTTLQKYLPAGDTYAVGAALIVGERSNLSQEVKQAFSNSGAVHVLSVSGLHVGVLAIVLRWVFSWVQLGKGVQKLSLGLELGSIWLFTILTGAAPATLRAAVMFSLIIGARAVLRQYNIWNILAASAFALLCWQPNLLWDIGFQLSFLAIAGIVAFQPWIYALWSAPNVVLDYIWKLTSVGIAAQLSTGPLSIFYFHQFPVFFWLSGLVAVPLSGVILVLGLLLFVLEAMHIPAIWIGKLLAFSIQLLNRLIEAIHHLPYAVASGFWWEAWATLAMYGVLALLCMALYRRKLGWLNAALLLLLTWALAHWPGIFQAQKQNQLICYHVPKASVLDLVQGRAVLTFSSTDSIRESMAAQNHRYHLLLKTSRKLEWGSRLRWGHQVLAQENLLIWRKHRIGIWDGNVAVRVPDKCDFLLLRNNPWVHPEDLPPNLKLIVVDGSNRFGTIRWMKKLAQEKGIPIHDTGEQGAWILPGQ